MEACRQEVERHTVSTKRKATLSGNGTSRPLFVRAIPIPLSLGVFRGQFCDSLFRRDRNVGGTRNAIDYSVRCQKARGFSSATTASRILITCIRQINVAFGGMLLGGCPTEP